MVRELIAAWDFGIVKGRKFYIEIFQMSDDYETIHYMDVNGTEHIIIDVEREIRLMEQSWSVLAMPDRTPPEQMELI